MIPTASELADELEALSKDATPGRWANGIDDLEGVCAPDTSFGNVICLPPEGRMFASLQKWDANAALIVSLRNNLPTILSALRQVEVMRGALEESAKTFRKYEASHDAKGTVEGKQKAAANAFMAAKCERALTGEAGAGRSGSALRYGRASPRSSRSVARSSRSAES